VENLISLLQTSPIVPVFYHADADHAAAVMAACYAGGVRCFEFTNRGANAARVFSHLRQYAHEYCPGLVLGIGTIFTAEEADTFIRAGADFVVQPITAEAVGIRCRAAGIPWAPGALTPNEVWQAWQLGAAIVKLFPGSATGPGYVRALRGPMPQPPLMVTGGVAPEPHSIRSWLEAGVVAVGIGGQLLDANTPPQLLTERIAGLLAQLK
jgi:2-dehydro-3-deoxyphosphogluconate aldolase/(4S)-4-hydroxy-2-oxoglutarate aldolase